MDPQEQLGTALLDAFRAQLEEDASTGGIRSLEDYWKVFPADAEAMAHIYLSTKRMEPRFGRETREGEDFIGPYRLIQELGRGGQGVVYLAEDSRLHRQVALKVLTNVALVSEGTLRRFQREAEVASRLEHPGICGVYEAGTADGVSYIAMQHIEGETLAARINAVIAAEAGQYSISSIVDFAGASDDETRVGSEPDTVATRSTTSTSMPRREIMRVLKIFEQAALALHVAHEAGITHRDIKPGNIMISRDGNPVILDFGLARMDEDEGPTITRSGDLFGTPAYMSPEQLTGNRIILDRSTDIWSLGVTLYRALTLNDAFSAATRQQLYQAILTKEPTDPRRLNPAIPPDLKVVLETAMDKDADRRYKTAEAFADDLHNVQELKPIIARPPGVPLRLRRWTQRNPALATAVAALFLMLAGGLGFFMTQAAKEKELRENHKVEVASLEVDRLLRRADEMWPAVPKMIPPMKSWIKEVEAIKKDIPVHQALLARFRERGLQSPEGKLVFEDIRDQWRHDEEEKLLRTMQEFQSDNRTGATIVAMRDRISVAESLVARTIEECADAWVRARKEVAEHPRYNGLGLEPQLGLIPLGKDPRSGLQEFAHLASGVPARRDPETGELLMEGDTGIVLVLIPGGKFTMGAQHSDKSKPNYEKSYATPGKPGRIDMVYQLERPPHPVELSPFFLSRYEMTQGQWLRFTGDNPSRFNPEGKEGRGHSHVDPVENVSWHVCTRVLFKLDLLIPTEAQWEYACRADTTTMYSSGDHPLSLRGHANLLDESFAAAADGHDDGAKLTSKVGAYLPNPWGLHDMHGNLYEWCRDYFGGYDDPVAPGDGLRQNEVHEAHITRGGSCTMGVISARSACRQANHAKTFDWILGVRPSRPLR